MGTDNKSLLTTKHLPPNNQLTDRQQTIAGAYCCRPLVVLAARTAEQRALHRRCRRRACRGGAGQSGSASHPSTCSSMAPFAHVTKLDLRLWQGSAVLLDWGKPLKCMCSLARV